MIRILKAELVLVMEIGDSALRMEIIFYVAGLEKNKNI
jgi:hypothetical protein